MVMPRINFSSPYLVFLYFFLIYLLHMSISLFNYLLPKSFQICILDNLTYQYRVSSRLVLTIRIPCTAHPIIFTFLLNQIM